MLVWCYSHRKLPCSDTSIPLESCSIGICLGCSCSFMFGFIHFHLCCNEEVGKGLLIRYSLILYIVPMIQNVIGIFYFLILQATIVANTANNVKMIIPGV